MQQEVYYPKQVNELKKVIAPYNAENILVVRANRSFQKSGAEGFINELLDNNKYVSFYDFDPNPQLSDLKKGISFFQKGKFDLIIAIGGGSVLDMAKLISVFSHQPENIEDLILGKRKIRNIKTPLLAIPTTAGTGAEATHFSVLYIDKKKYSVANESILPNWVFLSSNFTKTASPYLTASTGLDAFCQAVESVWSVNASEESIQYAKDAIRLIWGTLQDAVKLNDTEAKQHMLKAAYLAGKAINITKTTAPHALSYAFTSYYGIPHGHAVALTLPFFLTFNYQLSNPDCSDKRGVDEVKKRIQIILDLIDTDINDAENILNKFFLSIGIQTNIRKLINNFSTETIINNVNFERLNNNPRKVTTEVIIGFLKRF